jgi:hypothetical protein
MWLNDFHMVVRAPKELPYVMSENQASGRA